MSNVNVKSNLESLLKDAQSINISENKGGKSRESIYKNLSSLPSVEQKKMRTKLRRKGDNLCIALISSFKREKGIKEDTKKDASNLMQFYKENFILNDFSLSSFCSDNRNEGDKKIYQLALNILKDIYSK